MLALRHGDSPSWNNLSHLVMDLGPQTALISFFTTADRALLFIVRTGWETPEVVEVDINRTRWEDLVHRFYREVHLHDSKSRRGNMGPAIQAFAERGLEFIRMDWSG